MMSKQRLSREQILFQINTLKKQGFEQRQIKQSGTHTRVYLYRGEECHVVTYSINGWFSIE